MDANSEIKTLRHFIGGAWVDVGSGAAFDVLNPLDDSLYARAARGTGGDMRDAIAAARSAFPGYRESLPKDRKRWLLRVAEIMEERKSELFDCLIDWVPEDLAGDLRENGARSWPEVAKILEIEI
ncbi:MAG: aldehyde dehydrogenase family protein [Paracoccaceae bacterium]|nr:aldehyde dehydrogenase family protein [Paracoccaceae bacterium]MDE2913305.1 aldehyde dehydrogenase family protein [Paracoccaceae bacterium]